MRRFCTIDEFLRFGPDEQECAAITGMSAGSAEVVGESGRLIRYLFSTPDVGRDLHTVAADAWNIDDFMRNPVFLWAHDDTQPPIGRVVRLAGVGNELRGAVEYAEADLNPFADMIYRMVKAGYINATSTSWLPLDWTPTKDRSRPGGIDFKQVDLLEISNVPVPAMPDALAAARSSGIDLTPLKKWAARIMDLKLEPVPRGALEAIYRASDGRTERLRRLRTIQRNARKWQRDEAIDFVERAGRMDIGALLRGGAGVESTSENDDVIKRAHKLATRALVSHRDMAEHFETIGAHVKELRSVFREVTKTLTELGYARRRSETKADPMGAFERCIRALADSRGEANDQCEFACDALVEAIQHLADSMPEDAGSPPTVRAGASLQ
jgi:HK97 family phage prohead protease